MESIVWERFHILFNMVTDIVAPNYTLFFGCSFVVLHSACAVAMQMSVPFTKELSPPKSITVLYQFLRFCPRCLRRIDHNSQVAVRDFFAWTVGRIFMQNFANVTVVIYKLISTDVELQNRMCLADRQFVAWILGRLIFGLTNNRPDSNTTNWHLKEKWKNLITCTHLTSSVKYMFGQ